MTTPDPTAMLLAPPQLAPADHVTVALSHLDLDDLAKVRLRLRSATDAATDPAAIRLLAAVGDTLDAELAARRGQPTMQPPDLGPFTTRPRPRKAGQ